MKTNGYCQFLVFVAFLLLLSSPKAIAAIRPSFMLDDCVWHSTDIVLATEGSKIDGKLTILEVWKGNLRPGETVSVPELAAFAPQATRMVAAGYYFKVPDAVSTVTGSKMVLFLKKPQDPQGRWQSASMYEEMDTSVVWVEKDSVYGFVQLQNPGPTELIRLRRLTPQLMKENILSIVDTQRRIQSLITDRDLGRRAQGLETFVHSDEYYAREDAFDALSQCGRMALPVLRKMLKDQTLNAQQDTIITVFGHVGGAEVGPELTSLVESEMAFWRKTGPSSLEMGWWNGDGMDWSEVGPLRNHYSTLYSALNALDAMKYQADIPIVAKLLDFWQAFPPLDQGGQDQIIQICNKIVNHE